MAKQITMPQSDGAEKQFLPMIGSAVGSYFGPVGGMIGNALGGMASKEKGGQAGAVQTEGAERGTSPLLRRQKQIEEDPTTTLRQGKAALSTMDESTQKDLNPVIDEALRRAAEQRKQNGSQGY